MMTIVMTINANKGDNDDKNKEKNHAASAERTLVGFFDVVCQMTTGNFQI